MKQGLALMLVFILFASFFFLDGGVKAGSVSEETLTEINELWQDSAHAVADVNCSSCHLENESQEVIAQPSHESCRSCHERTVDTFLLGKHGVRLKEGLSPLQPHLARLPMKEEAFDKQMNCNTCHDVHSVNTTPAAVDACLTCHNDTHSRNFFDSRHGEMWLAQEELARPSEEAVSCATCHLPRQETESDQVFVNHDNTYTLLPRDRAVSEVCMNCHGMEYSYNSIFDDDLVESNFARPPTLELQTIEMIQTFEEQRQSRN